MNIKLENGHLKKKIEINLRIIKMYVIMIKYKNNKNKKIIILYDFFNYPNYVPNYGNLTEKIMKEFILNYYHKETLKIKK